MKSIANKLKGVVCAALTLALALGAQAEDHDCITFASKASFKLYTNTHKKSWTGNIYYSTDKSSWSVWLVANDLTAAQDSSTGEYRLYLYGDDDNVEIATFLTWVLEPTPGNTIACRGDIETLRGATATKPAGKPMAEACYNRMFENCTALTEAPTLTATTLAPRCYWGMFNGCTALTNAPALPAETLANQCYAHMFQGCKALTNAPALPAKTLADSCYNSMFQGCTALTNAPALPVETLAISCYASMFKGCTALANAPALPAKTLAGSCYANMFEGCTALANAPALLAETLPECCYQKMFSGCTSLTKVPALPATQLNFMSYSEMFKGCTSLVVNENAPGAKWSIPADAEDISVYGMGVEYDMENMFLGTGGTFTGTPEVGKTYYVESDWKREVDLGGGMTARDYYDGDWAIVGNGEVAAAQTALLKGEGVTNLWIHTGVTGVGANAFTDSAFWTLRDVTLGAACTSVGDRAFKKCYGLTNVTSRATDASTIGKYAFSGCHSLQSLSFAGAASFDEQAYTLQAAIYMKDGGIPVVYAMPTITVAGKSEHIMGKKTLADEWTDVTNFTDDEKKPYHFFKIEMK